jgi:hypothetical protein
MLKTNKPLGIREIQRTLNLSSPSVAQYHLSKLEHARLLKRERGNYVVNKVLLENCVRVSRFLVPRYLFYSVFSVAILLIEVIFLRPQVLTREFFFALITTITFTIIFCFETAKIWIRRSL